MSDLHINETASAAFAAALSARDARTLERPTRLLETLDGQQWFVFQRETYEVERRGRLHWQVVARYRVLDQLVVRDTGPRFRFRRTARRHAKFLDSSPGYHPVLGPVDALTAIVAIDQEGSNEAPSIDAEPRSPSTEPSGHPLTPGGAP